MSTGLEITGLKPGGEGQRSANSKLLVGEKMSLCGKFAISSAGKWRELPVEDQVPQVPQFEAVDTEGRPMPNPPR